MALRVLLADNSETIKKVVQLSLQEFGVEVKSVNVGIDVLNVAKIFQPQIVLADILLQKKNGYEVCAELKTDPQLSSVPVVLMWSGFLELDEKKAQQCGADGRLEKPFDSEKLRDVVRSLVSGLDSTDTQPPSPVQFKAPPGLPITPAPKTSAPAPQVAPQTIVEPMQTMVGHTIVDPATRTVQRDEIPEPIEPAHAWSMDSFDDIKKFEPPSIDMVPADAPPPHQFETFSKVEIGKNPLQSTENLKAMEQPLEVPEIALGELGGEVLEDTGAEDWKVQSLSSYKLNFSKDADEQVAENFKFKTSEEEIKDTTFLFRPESFSPPTTVQPLTPPPSSPTPSLSSEELEAIVRAQSKEVIEQLVMKIVPEIATDLIQKELRRLIEPHP